MIATSTPGRLRLRAPGLRDTDALEALVGRLAGLEGVHAVTPNPLVGSLLVTYAPERLSEAALLDALGVEAAAATAAPTRRRRLPRRALELAIVSSLGLSVGAAVVGAKPLHVAAGSAFLALAGLHIHRAGGLTRWRRARAARGV